MPEVSYQVRFVHYMKIKPFATICEIMEHVDFNNRQDPVVLRIARGDATGSTEEQYSRVDGRVISFTRALDVIGDEKLRRQIRRNYYKQHPKDARRRTTLAFRIHPGRLDEPKETR